MKRSTFAVSLSRAALLPEDARWKLRVEDRRAKHIVCDLMLTDEQFSNLLAGAITEGVAGQRSEEP